MIAPRHSRLREAVMMDWLRDISERGHDTLPSPHDIMARFDFDDSEAARTLIAQLADTGIIRVRRFSGGATFEILPPRPPRCAVSTVNRMVDADDDDEAQVDDLPLSRRESRQVEAAFAKIKRAMAAPVKQPMLAVPRITPAKPLPKVETVRETKEVGSPRCATPDQGPEVTSAVVAAETVSEPVASPLQPMGARHLPCGHPDTPDNARPGRRGRESCRMCKNAYEVARRAGIRGNAPVKPAYVPRFTRAGSGKITMNPTPEQYAAIVAMAKTRNVPVSTVANEIVMRGLDAAEPLPKPHIDRDMMRAWKADGRPFAQFFRDMVMLGIEASAQFRVAAE